MPTNWHERPLVFDCAGDELLGILTLPEGAADAGKPSVLIIVGGPQYRAGSHRLFVEVARSLANAGHAVLRFDVRGMGDSSGAQRNFEQLSEDIAAAVDVLTREVPGSGVVLWGLCDAASAALLYVDTPCPDRRVVGLCLLNPWVRSEATLARTHIKRYYLQRLRQGDFWAKLACGGIALQAAQGLVGNLSRALKRRRRVDEPMGLDRHYPTRMARGWRRFHGPRLVVLSGRDLTAQEFDQVFRSDPDWSRPGPHGDLDWLEINDADHTLSAEASMRTLIECTLRWLSPAAPRTDQASRPDVAPSMRSASAARELSDNRSS